MCNTNINTISNSRSNKIFTKTVMAWHGQKQHQHHINTKSNTISITIITISIINTNTKSNTIRMTIIIISSSNSAIDQV